jgi:hypothetical protein
MTLSASLTTSSMSSLAALMLVIRPALWPAQITLWSVSPAVGEYSDVPGGTDGLLITRSGTTWTAAEAPMPTDVLTPGDASLASVSCPATCVAVGFYRGTDTPSPSSRYGQGQLVTGSP